MIKFKYEGTVRTGFAAIFREVGPDEEFDVPEELALSFDAHGHCTCLEPEKLAPLRAARDAEQAAQDELRASSGLVNAHPAAQKAAAEKTAVAAAEETDPLAPAVDQAPPSAPEPEAVPAAPTVSKRAKADAPPATTATAK